MRKVGHYILQISWDTASIVVSRSFDPWYNLALEEMLSWNQTAGNYFIPLAEPQYSGYRS